MSWWSNTWKGDFDDQPTTWAGVGGQVGLGLVPLAGQIADFRDTVAKVKNVAENPKSGAAWAGLGGAVVGWIPVIGDGAKGAAKVARKVAAEVGPEVFHQASRHADDLASVGAKTAKEVAESTAKLRRAAVDQAWKQEKELLERTGEGTRRWSQKEKQELLKRGKVKGYEGHHVNSVKAHPELAGDPDNVRFVRGRKEHLREHGGNFRNSTEGDKVDRSRRLDNARKTQDEPTN